MHFIRNFCAIIVITAVQVTLVEQVTISSSVIEKLRSIRQWLDTTHDATVYDYIYRVNKGAGLNLFEGDIKGYNPKHSQLRTAVTNHQFLWNTRIVPYTIDTAFDSASRKDILAAFQEYHNKTCLRFVPRTTEADFVHIKQISGCYSNVGRAGGEQELSLAGPCLKKGTAIHELMHALGFWHEQNRPDRDSWVQIISSNIQTGKEYNFDKLTSNEVDTLGEQYDYGSVMHYSKYAFSKNGNPTIIPTRKTSAELGQREGLSEHDVHRINTLYRCDTHVPTSTSAPARSPTPPVKITKATTTKKVPTKPVSTKPPVTKTPMTQQKTTVSPSTHLPTTSKQSKITTATTTATTTRSPEIKTTRPTRGTTHQNIVSTTYSKSPTTKTTTAQSVSTQLAPKTPSAPTGPPVPPNQTGSHITSVYVYGWTEWSRWAPCDLTCRHSRYRFCLNYDPRYCPGENRESRDCPYSCKRGVPLGCWKETATQYLVPSAENQDVTLSDPYTTRTMAVRKCADFAARNGYSVFAIFDGGMCRTGPTAYLTYNIAGPSRDCSYRGTGSKDASNVYTFSTDIDGGWSAWTGWSQCTKTCGLGRQYRYRSCDNPVPVGNGAQCPGDHRQVAICNLQTCRVSTKCGSQFHAGGPGTSGLIWVRDYDNFMECEYLIATGDPLSSISLLIQDLDLEYSRGCIYDTLMIHDGRDRYAPFVGAFCGRTSPVSFESTSNRVYLKFESDETKTGRGFTVFYTINSRSKKACVRPPSAAHVVIASEGNMVGNRVFYSCEPGFRMVGHSPITCIDQPGFALWDDNFPRCVLARKRSVRGRPTEVCTFENSLCGFKNHKKNNFDWRVQQQGNNSVLLSQSSRLQAAGDISRITSGELHSGPGTNCIKFRYIIDGGHDVVLNIFLVGVNELDKMMNNSLIWNIHGVGEGNFAWQDAAFEVESTENFRIMFDAVIWEEIGSQVIIDDVEISPKPCSQ